MKQHHLVLTVSPDCDVEDPTSSDGWKLYSFCRKHNSFRDPEEIGLSLKQDADGLPVVKSPGLRSKLKAGLAFWLSYYEHSGCIWFLRGSHRPGVEFQWDGVRTAGLLVWEQPAKNLGPNKYVDRYKDAEGLLKTYTAWANGEAMYYILEDEDGDVLESCGGFYTLDDAMQTFEEEALAGHEGKPIIVRGDMAETVCRHYPLDGHQYIRDESELVELPDPEYAI